MCVYDDLNESMFISGEKDVLVFGMQVARMRFPLYFNKKKDSFSFSLSSHSLFYLYIRSNKFSSNTYAESNRHQKINICYLR